jgi:hypothetical protein
MHVEQYSRTDHNKWIFSEHSDSHDSLNLAAIACQILLEDIYDKVDFEVNK